MTANALTAFAIKAWQCLDKGFAAKAAREDSDDDVKSNVVPPPQPTPAFILAHGIFAPQPKATVTAPRFFG